MRTALAVFLEVVLPIVVGGIIYLGLRAESLLMFQWAEALHIVPMVDALRDSLGPLRKTLPEFVLYSLPDGLWGYSMGMAQALIWQKAPNKWSWILVGGVPALAFFGEIGQAVDIVPGTFCWNDLTVTAVAVLACLLNFRIRTRGYINGKGST